jgi:hypothetical protein
MGGAVQKLPANLRSEGISEGSPVKSREPAGQMPKKKALTIPGFGDIFHMSKVQ